VRFCAEAPFPRPDAQWRDDGAERDLGQVIRAVTRVRNLRRESGLPQQKRVAVVLLCDDAETRALLGSLGEEMTRLALLSSIEVKIRGDYAIPKQAAVDAEPEFDLVIPLEGVIDLDAERERIEKDLERARKELTGYERKLANESYVNKAPADVVEETRKREIACRERIASLESALARL
jgi:valyl-tRNA synthetase